MDKVEIAKKIVNATVGLSASFVMGQVIKNNVNPENTLQKVEAQVGGMVLGYIVSDYATKFISQKFDETVKWWKKTKEETETES